jgi:WD40 repeat protein
LFMSKRPVYLIFLLLCAAVFPAYTQTAHEGALNDIAWNPEGGEFATCGDDGRIIVWDADTFEPKRSFQAHDDYALCLAYNSDGSLLVSGGADYSVILWDTESYEGIRIFTGHTDYVRSVAFHPEGGTLASAGDDGMVFLWDIETGNALAEFTGHVDYVRSVAFSPDGTYLASGSDDTTVILWNLETNRQERVFRHHDDYVRAVAFSPRGDLLASAGDDSLINIINLKTGRRIHSFRAHDDYVRDIIFSPDGEKLISAGDDGRVRIWDYRQETLLNEHAEHGGYVYAVSAGPAGSNVVSGGDNGSLYVYNFDAQEIVFQASGISERDPEQGEEPQDFMCAAFHPREEVVAAGTIDGRIYVYDSAEGELLEELEGAGEAVYLLRFSPDGRYLFSTGSEYKITIWDYPSLTKAAVLEGFSDYVWAVDVTADNSYLLCGDASGIVHLFSMNDFSRQNRFQVYQSAVTDIAAQPGSNRFATSSESGRVDVWGLPGGKRYKSLGTPHTSMITGIEYSSDGKYLVTAELNGNCAVWQAETYYEVTSGYIHDESLYALDISLDETGDLIVTGGEAPALRVLRIPELEEITRAAEVESPVTKVAVSAAGRQVLAVSEMGNVTVLETATGAALYALEAPGGGYPEDGEMFEEDFMVLTVAVSGNDRYLAAGGSDGVVRLWDYRTGSLLAVLEGHTDYVRSVAFSPDNRLLASGSDDGTIKLWDVEEVRLLRTLRGHTDYVRSVAFSDDGTVLISGSDDGTVRVWDMGTYDTIRIIEAHEGYVLSVDTMRGGGTFLSGGEDGKVHVWNREGKLLKSLEFTGSTDK